MIALLGSAACMSWASKPVPDMIPKPRTCFSPFSSSQLISPRSSAAVLPMRQARARAEGSKALPMLAHSRFAVPEGKTQAGTSLPRRACSSVETVPSPPDRTTMS